METFSCTIPELIALDKWLFSISIKRCQFEDHDVVSYEHFYNLVKDSPNHQDLVTLTAHDDYLFVTYEKAAGIWAAHRKSKFHVIGDLDDPSGIFADHHDDIAAAYRRHCGDALLAVYSFAEIIQQDLFNYGNLQFWYNNMLWHKTWPLLDARTICLGDIVWINPLSDKKEAFVVTLSRSGEFRLENINRIPSWKNLPIGFLLYYQPDFFASAQLAYEEYFDDNLKERFVESFELWRPELVEDFPDSKLVQLYDVI